MSLFPMEASFFCTYAETKRQAEQLILEANNGTSLLTTALRPHLIWGPGDPHFIPRLLAKYDSGKLRMVGAKKNLVDIVYIDNARDAHIQALKLIDKNKSIQGKAFFIAQEEAVNLWEFINKLLIVCGRQKIKKSISYPSSYFLGYLCELFYKSMKIKKEPPMTRFVAMQLGKSHFFFP